MVDTITTNLEPVPSRSAPNTFSERMDAWLGKISTWTSEANALAAGANTNATTAQAAAETAETAETNAAASESAAASSAQTAINAPGTSATSATSVLIGTGSKSLTIQASKEIVVGMFVLIARTSAPENYMAGQVTSYNSGTGALAVSVDAVGGSGTYTDWTVSLSALTFSTASEAEMQAGTETSLRVMSPALVAAHVNARIDYQEFTSSGMWTKPANVTVVYVEAIGGGACGGAAIGTSSTGGGGGGAFANKAFLASSLGATETVAIGAGGGAVTRADAESSGITVGNDGGDTTFGSHLTAAGGKGSAMTFYGGSGGGGESGQSDGYAAGGYSSGAGGTGSQGEDRMAGGRAVMGGGGGGGTRDSIGAGIGGASQNGGNGGNGRNGNSNSAITGYSGTAPGGGGGGCTNSIASGTSRSATSGAGADGRLRIWAW